MLKRFNLIYCTIQKTRNKNYSNLNFFDFVFRTFSVFKIEISRSCEESLNLRDFEATATTKLLLQSIQIFTRTRRIIRSHSCPVTRLTLKTQELLIRLSSHEVVITEIALSADGASREQLKINESFEFFQPTKNSLNSRLKQLTTSKFSCLRKYLEHLRSACRLTITKSYLTPDRSGSNKLIYLGISSADHPQSKCSLTDRCANRACEIHLLLFDRRHTFNKLATFR